ncbi:MULTISPECIES: sugar transferase [unclassified Mesorhizobium]|uniref:sugar transferase n=1 Tax=unclassified Mesorhizobium TaxID=325217 RepID=UPI0011267556|nr:MULTISPECIES: sugar transferase [unclassified Mesorhizobium]TPL01803.1 sugar transferase [Mesorhizobium sp. B2-4-16]TPL68847.1 sugar transferase [Mesorhizobium sp. B2-4-3]
MTAKRALDLAVAVPMLVAAAPVLLVALLAIRATSPGPAIFSQTRVGRGGALFACRKLRTMYRATPSLPTHEAPAGSVTAVGKVLRATKIDELPQLWNVLKGEMSLVGPRPCLPTQTELIERRRELGVLTALPGITGLAQIKGIDMSDPRLCAETDAAYINAASTGLDLKILLGTLF